MTGQTVGQAVVDVIEGSGMKDLVALNIDANHDGNADKVSVATAGHPFFERTATDFTEAGTLRPGHSILQNSAGAPIDIAAVHRYRDRQRVLILTVAVAHTYYFVVDGEAIWVHNCAKKKYVPRAKKVNNEFRRYPNQKAARRAAKKYEKCHRKQGCYYDDVCRMGNHVHVRYPKKGSNYRTIHFGS